MRACEGCRRRKIKCDAATTNTWPCSACIRLKLHCVRPNGFDGSTDAQIYEPPRAAFESSHVQDGFRQQLPLQDQQLMAGAQKTTAMFPPQASYQDPSGLYHNQYPGPQAVPHNIHYTTVPPAVTVVDQSYPPPQTFPTPPMHQGSRSDSPPDVYQQEEYGQDLADLLGSLKVNEAGTGTFVDWTEGSDCLTGLQHRISTTN
jgi:hypothetical protein